MLSNLPISALLKEAGLWDPCMPYETMRVLRVYHRRPHPGEPFNMDEVCAMSAEGYLEDPYPLMKMLEASGELELPRDMGKHQ